MTLRNKTEILKDMFPVLLMAVIIYLVYNPLIYTWFLGDDTQWMWFSAVNPVWEIFFDSGTYLYINDANFTPMLGLSFKTDWAFFQMSPAGYNIHNLVSVFTSSIMLYLFLRLFTGRIVSFSASILFIINPATAAVMGCFSNRHYLEGMFWALTSLYLFVRNEREKKIYFLIFSCITYMLASLSKEVYLLLPVFLFIIANGNAVQRFKKTSPFWILLLMYIPWRWFMLGRKFGGYYFIDWSFENLFSNTVKAVVLPIRYVYDEYWIVFFIALFMISVLILFRKNGIAWYAKASVMYFIALSPIVPIMAIFLLSGPSGGRYAFQITTFIIIIFTAAYFLFIDNKILKILITMLFLFSLPVFLMQNLKVTNAFIEDRQKSREESMKFLANNKYLNGIYPVWFYDGLRRLEKSFNRREIRTVVYYEDSLKYHETDFIKEIKGEEALPYLEAHEQLKDRPISVYIQLNGRKVEWRLGPESIKFFHLLMRRENETYYLYPPVRNKGRHIFAKDFVNNENIYFRIFYRLPYGQEVVSPEIRILIPGSGHYHYISEESAARFSLFNS